MFRGSNLLANAAVALVVFAAGAMPAAAQSGRAACEAKIKATGMLSMPGDERVACEQDPSVAAQDCMIEILTKGKGKLRNQDFPEIIGLCIVDASKDVRSCVLGRLDKPWNDPGYVGVKSAGDYCLAHRKYPKVTYAGKPVIQKKKSFGRIKIVPGLKEAVDPVKID